MTEGNIGSNSLLLVLYTLEGYAVKRKHFYFQVAMLSWYTHIRTLVRDLGQIQELFLKGGGVN